MTIDRSDPFQLAVLESINVDPDLPETEELVGSAYAIETGRPLNLTEAMEWFWRLVEERRQQAAAT